MSGGLWKWLALICAAIFLAGAFELTGKLNDSRQSMNLVQVSLPNEARPDLLANVLLSVGRALAVDYLWIGATNLQQQGRYFDAMQRAEWICQLQPRFPSVWIFHSWNMSYNISVTMPTGPERWLWVRNGYELLRDRGIPLNPNSVGLYRQLAWIFHHKIGAHSDNQHWYYKLQLAREMEDIIGWPDPDYQAITTAVDSWQELLEDQSVAWYVKALEEMQVQVPDQYLELLKTSSQQGSKLRELLEDDQYKPSRRKVAGFLRAERLRTQWKLDPALIGELREPDMYGPLDFRTAQAQAIYWAVKGLRQIGQEGSIETLGEFGLLKDTKKLDKDVMFDALACARIIYGSLQDIVKRGRIFLPQGGQPLFSPDLRFVDVLHRVYLALGKADMEETWDGTAGPTFMAGHINYLRKIIAIIYQYGREDLARKYWNILTKLYPNGEYDVGMVRFVHNYILEEVVGSSMVDVNTAVGAHLIRAYSYYAVGDDYSALAMEKLAGIVYETYMKDRRSTDASGRVLLAPMRELKLSARDYVLRTIPHQLANRLRDRLGMPLEDQPELSPLPAENNSSP